MAGDKPVRRFAVAVLALALGLNLMFSDALAQPGFLVRGVTTADLRCWRRSCELLLQYAALLSHNGLSCFYFSCACATADSRNR